MPVQPDCYCLILVNGLWAKVNGITKFAAPHNQSTTGIFGDGKFLQVNHASYKVLKVYSRTLNPDAKHTLVQANMLSYPIPEAPISMSTDATVGTVGAIINS